MDKKDTKAPVMPANAARQYLRDERVYLELLNLQRIEALQRMGRSTH